MWDILECGYKVTNRIVGLQIVCNHKSVELEPEIQVLECFSVWLQSYSIFYKRYDELVCGGLTVIYLLKTM